MPKISVVIPVYNLQDYVERAVRSITEQTFKDVEIIVVNDGSTDNSLDIIKNLAKADKRIIIIDQDNTGPDMARNRGFDVATGEWVCFFDGDDYMHEDALEKLYNAAKNCDMVVCNSECKFLTYTVHEFFRLPTEREINSDDRIRGYFLGKIIFGDFTNNKLYRSEFLRSTGVKYESRQEIFAEDAFFLAKVLKTMGRINVVNESLMVYFKRENSETMSVKENLLPRCERFLKGISEWYDHEYDDVLKTRAFRFFYDILYNDVNLGYIKFKKATQNKFFLNMIKGMDASTLTVKQRLIVKLLNHPTILYSIMRKRGINFGKSRDELPASVFETQRHELVVNINLLDRQHMIKYIANTIFVQSIKEKRKKIIAFALAVFVFMLFANAAYFSKNQTMILRCNYTEAAKGFYPDGTWFDIFAIKSEEVLNDVIEKYNITSITAQEMQDRISVFAITNGDVISKAVSANSSGKDFYYITNEYAVTYNQKNKFAVNQAFRMLRYISESYKEMFFEKYTEKNKVLEFNRDEIDFDDLEYIEIGSWFTNEVESIQRFITERASENGSFRSLETNQTFINIEKMLKNFVENDLEQYKGFVSQSGLAKNKSQYKNKLNYKISMLNIDKSKQQLAHDFRVKAIEQYDSYITGVAFIPSVDSNNRFYMNRTMIGIDYLTDEAYQAGYNAETYEKAIQEYNATINNIDSNNHDDEEFDRLTTTADEMIAGMCDKLEQISDIAVKTDNEYVAEKTMSYLEFKIPKETIMTSLDPVGSVCAGVAAGVAAALAIWIEAVISAKIAILKNEEEEETSGDKD